MSNTSTSSSSSSVDSSTSSSSSSYTKGPSSSTSPFRPSPSAPQVAGSVFANTYFVVHCSVKQRNKSRQRHFQKTSCTLHVRVSFLGSCMLATCCSSLYRWKNLVLIREKKTFMPRLAQGEVGTQGTLAQMSRQPPLQPPRRATLRCFIWRAWQRDAHCH